MQIRRIEIENFRSIVSATWLPGPGVNALLGSGDSGKSTVLDAIALVLSPQPSQAATETDYRNLDTATTFRVGIVVGQLSDEVRAAVYPPPLWGWDAEQRTLVNAPDDDRGYEAVLHLDVLGTEDLELIHRLLQPGNEPRALSVATRAAIGLWNVSTNRAPEAQLRMARGSLLEKAVGRDRLRAPAVAAMQGTVDTLQVPDDTTQALSRVAEHLRDAGIQFDELALSLVPGSGQSPVQLVTLIAKSRDGHVPLANFGRGSQQMAMVTLAAAEIVSSPIAVIDELEAGLEPYRQRALLARLRTMVADGGQAFITSHSPAILGLLREGEAWKLQRGETHVADPITGDLARLLRDDPEALLCRLPVICEGATEVGVLRAFFGERVADIGALGVHLVDAGGHDMALRYIEALGRDARHIFGMVDDELVRTGKRAQLAAEAHIHLCISPGGRCIECAVANALPIERLPELVRLPGVDGAHFNEAARLQSVSERLGRQSRESIPDLLAAYAEKDVRTAVGEAAASGWFKTPDAGLEFGQFIAATVTADHPLTLGIRALVGAALNHVGVRDLDAPS